MDEVIQYFNFRNALIFKKYFFVFLLFFTLIYFSQNNAESIGGEKMEIKVKSSAFDEGGMIPRKYTCDGSDVSPPLEWGPLPEGTKSLAIIFDDPDAPGGTWVHWVLFNLPRDDNNLPENVPPLKKLPNGSKQGTNDFRKIGYGGPCPPGGTHRYFFKIYALNIELDLDGGATKPQLLKAMEGHILAEGQLMGRYQR